LSFYVFRKPELGKKSQMAYLCPKPIYMTLMTMIILQAGSSMFSSILFPALMLAFFYFFFIRPQMKKQKEQNSFAASLKKGDDVVTTSGIIGQISKIEDNSITLEVENKMYIRVVSGAISKEMTDQFNAKQK
jgi:preprotein translocase subunit YajC